ncbi:BMP family protein [Hoeflea sp.]|uniref:BMP family protein n=1 Tax=Hoeflea sp. TaxID=1940281 RepID=UPI003B0281ED
MLKQRFGTALLALGMSTAFFVATPSGAEAETSVALVLPGSIADGGWNAGAYQGLKKLEGSDDFRTAFSENVSQADIPRVVRGYADDGYDLIIGHGFQFGSLFAEISPDYPDQKFFATTSAPGGSEIPSNAMYLDARYPDVAYGAGTLAAHVSKSGNAVGVVGGGDNPITQMMTGIFKASAEAAGDGIKGYAIITGDYNDAAKGREASATMIGNGADVIWHIADITGIGAVEGAASKGATVIGMFADQKELAPDNIAVSFVSNNAGLVEEVAKMVNSGSFEGGKSWVPELTFLWLTSYGSDQYNKDLISDDAWSQFQRTWNDIGTGKINSKSIAE